MATVKFKWHQKLGEKFQKYLSRDNAVEKSTHALEGNMIQAIEDEHESQNSRAKNIALEVYQSWPENERERFEPEKFNEMGQEFAKRLAPGHLAWVYTHTNTKCIHNHIIICTVNSETGKLLENKKALVFKARDINDTIARENGLSFLESSFKAQQAKLPEHVKAMEARGKQTWRMDLLRKVEFARSAATSFDEYREILEPMKVFVRAENKNISYSYGDRKKAIRGNRVGKNFTKDGLIKAFKENDERFAKSPGLRERIFGNLGQSGDPKGDRLGASSNLLLESASYPNLSNKDYGKFTKIDRRDRRVELPHAFTDPHSILASEIRKTKDMSIFEFCKGHNIGLATNKDGKTVLRGREHIVITSPTEYRNTKGRTVGGIIDFVAYHDGTDYLAALSKLNSNPRILLLNHVMGERTQTYRAFYPPKPVPGFTEGAKKTLGAFLHSRGMKATDSEALLKSRQVHVGKDQSIWFVGEKGDSAMEFRQEPDGKWRGKRHGKPTASFFESIGKSSKLAVYNDPFEFSVMKGRGSSPNHHGANTLVLFGDNSRGRLDEIVALNPHIKEINFIRSGRTQEREHERTVEHEIKKRFDPFRIEVTGISIDPSRSRGRGPDISL